MADIAPLRAFRYSSDALPDVIAPPYDVIGPEERAQLGRRSDHNIVHIDLPEGTTDAKYESAARILQGWIRDGVLKRDPRGVLLVYEQDFLPPDGHARVTRRGFFALVRAESYETKSVLPHERTLSGPKEDRYKLMRATQAALSPVFLLYNDPKGTTRALFGSGRLETEFETPDGIRHRLSTVDDPRTIAAALEGLRDRALLIADGHHRYETTVRYASEVDRERGTQHAPPLPRGAHRYAMAYLCDADDPGLLVFPTHRLVHGLQSFDVKQFLDAASSMFEVRHARGNEPKEVLEELVAAGASRPSFAAAFPDGAVHILTLRDPRLASEHPTLRTKPAVLRTTDVVLLHTLLIQEVLGISEEQQARQTNITYLKSTSDALRRIRAGEGNVLFVMNPTPVDVVRSVCESGEVMPQKSTYFYPKVPTGLAIHRLDPDETVEAVFG